MLVLEYVHLYYTHIPSGKCSNTYVFVCVACIDMIWCVFAHILFICVYCLYWYVWCVLTLIGVYFCVVVYLLGLAGTCIVSVCIALYWLPFFVRAYGNREYAIKQVHPVSIWEETKWIACLSGTLVPLHPPPRSYLKPPMCRRGLVPWRKRTMKTSRSRPHPDMIQ